MRYIRSIAFAGATMVVAGLGTHEARALDGTIAQNSAWNVARTGPPATHRIVAYGDSITAGYIDVNTIARRSAHHTAAEYAAALYGTNIEVRRRAQSGALAQGIFNRINSTTDRAFMQSANTIGVSVISCGNDYLGARSSFAGQSGQCSYDGLQNALNTCQQWTAASVQSVNTHANANVKLKMLGNLYYPGFESDNQLTNCTDPESGERINRRDRFLPLIAEHNWRTCVLAEENGWHCLDNFAEYMAADYDSNDDGFVDNEYIRYRSGEPFEEYLARILDAYEQGLLSDSNFKEITPSQTAGYLLSDNTHMTYLGPDGKAGLLGGTPGGNVAVYHSTDGPYPDFRNPTWNLNGSDRMGHAIARSYDLSVDAGTELTILEGETLERTATFNDRVFWGPWPVWVDYGNGQQLNDVFSEEAIPLNARYDMPGDYNVELVVTGAYDTLWEAGVGVTVLSTEQGMGVLDEWLESLRNDLNRGQYNGIRQPFNNASRMLGNGMVNPFRSMMDDFTHGVGGLIASGALDPATGAEIVSYADRLVASSFVRERPRGTPPFGRAKGRPERVEIPQGEIVEEQWIEIDGTRYDLDDPALLEFYNLDDPALLELYGI